MSKPLSELLSEIQKRADSATEGPWRTATCRDGIYAGEESLVKSGMSEVVGVRQLGYAQHNNLDNIQFIARSRTDIPKLLAVIDKLVQQRNYVADYPIEGPKDIERLNAELAEILTKGG